VLFALKVFSEALFGNCCLCEYEADSLADGLNNLFENEVEIPRIKHGNKQTLDTLISEEALLLAKYLRNERKTWSPRIVSL